MDHVQNDREIKESSPVLTSSAIAIKKVSVTPSPSHNPRLIETLN